MNSQFIGSLVSLNCGEVLGTYQGQVMSIDACQGSITIVNAFQNGIACSVPRITLNACDIHDLQIIKNASEAQSVTPLNKHVRQVSKEKPAVNQTDVSSTTSIKILDFGSQAQRKVSDSQGLTNGLDMNGDVNYNCFAMFGLNPCGSKKSKNVVMKAFNNVNGLNYNDHGVLLKASNSNEYRPRSVNGKKSPPITTVPAVCNGLKEDCRSKSAGDFIGMTSEEFLNASTSAQFVTNLRNRTTSACEVNTPVVVRKSITPRKDNKRQQQQRTDQQLQQKKQQLKEDCFTAPVNVYIDEEFDFESNLALFDKQAVYDEIEKDGSVATIACRSEPKYRCDENVLQSTSVVYRQIKVKGNGSVASGKEVLCGSERGKEFVTDTGLVVPSITAKAKERLFAEAERCGFSKERRLEMIGRSAGEMVLQLLGGSNRFNPKNSHQRPIVVVVCGGGQEGLTAAAGLNCARQLACRAVSITVLMLDDPSASNELVTLVAAERRLFALTRATITSKLSDLNNIQADLIVSALDCFTDPTSVNQSLHQSAVEWMNESKAPVLSIDPPLDGGGVNSKWCITDALPLAFSEACGQVYLSDLGVPHQVFKEIGVMYRSPFAHKYVIPLYESCE